MYIALAIMCAGVIVGRLVRSRLSVKILNRCALVAIMALLFLMGVSIGSDRQLLAKLPTLGKYSAILTACYLAGSIFAQIILKKSSLLKYLKK